MNVTTKRLQQEGTPKQPSSPRKKRKQLGQGKNNAPKKKRIRTKCSSEGCTNNAQIGGVCIRHGAKQKTCTREGCTNVALKGGVCRRHGAKHKNCSHEGCTNVAQKGGVCIRHGASWKRRTCSHEGCTKVAQNKGVCISHGAKQKTCSHKGCTNNALKGGVCVRHGAKRKICSHDGWTKQVVNNGVCISHGAKQSRKICSHDRCNNQVRKSGVCKRHAKSMSKSNTTGHVDLSATLTTKVAASRLAPTPAPVPSLCKSNNADSRYNEDTDNEIESSGNQKCKTEECPVKKEEDEAYDLDTDEESEVVKKVPV